MFNLLQQALNKAKHNVYEVITTSGRKNGLVYKLATFILRYFLLVQKYRSRETIS